MAPQIQVSEELFARLERLAIGFDTAERVIERFVDNVSKTSAIKLGRREPPVIQNKRVVPRKITRATASRACRLGDELYAGDITQETAKKILSEMGMNSSSAHIYLYNFVAMMNGKVFKRSMKIADIAMFLDYIRQQHGKRAFRSALNSFEQHILYAEAKGYSTIKKRALLIDMKQKLKKLVSHFGKKH